MRWGWFMAAMAAGLGAGATPAWADEEPLATVIEGLYQGSGEGTLSMTLISLEGDTFAALVTTGVAERCAGRLSGIGKLDEAELVIENVESRDDAVCRITVTFDNRGLRARMVSAGQCTYFHGAACSFKGTLNQVVVPPRLRPKRAGTR